MKTFEQHWDEIETWFDFQKVKKTMEFLEWHWGWGDNKGVPSLIQIIEGGKERAKEAYDRKGTSNCGGFYAEYNKKFDRLTLEFILENWTTNDA